ncbi:hypothetical protein DEO72_LG11g3968 [Vigna unguiculata]|uniref:Uncharacterized protein n=1 Tax=Vigna unguiculata TaxID=3917 RepID=A0A4D6NWB4_VIGUN|nr:hypothetical protein DEO72_LG11g3968 [Vigna unguiculata]
MVARGRLHGCARGRRTRGGRGGGSCALRMFARRSCGGVAREVAERRSSSAAAAVQMAREDEEFAVAVNGGRWWWRGEEMCVLQNRGGRGARWRWWWRGGCSRSLLPWRRWCVKAAVGGGGTRALVAGKGWRRRLCGGWKERRKLGLGFWEMKMMTWQPFIGQLVSARIVATWLALVG